MPEMVSHRSRIRLGRSLRSLGSPLNARPFGGQVANWHLPVANVRWMEKSGWRATEVTPAIAGEGK
jgi:hypothetical protein